MTSETGVKKWYAGTICGCGNPAEAHQALLDLLRLLDGPPEERFTSLRNAQILAYCGSQPMLALTLNLLTNMGLIEHGGSIGGSWITDRGHDLLKLLESASPDFTSLDEYIED